MKPAVPGQAVDRLFELATRLPWWGALLSALAAYAVLQPIAVLQMPTASGMLNLVATALAQLFVLLAQIGQYLLPLGFLVAAAVSGFDRWRRGELRESVAQDTTGSTLRGLPWADFELLVGDAFRRKGYDLCAPRTDSQALDRALEVTRDGRRFLVDCTDWRSWKAGAAAIRRLHERMQGADAAGGFAVTSGQFTPEAKHFAADKDIGLIDGRHLKGLAGAEPQLPEKDPFLVLVRLRSSLARWRRLLPTSRHSSIGEMATREPGIRFFPGQAPDIGGSSPRSATDEVPVAADDVEIAAGRQLSALIRAEHRIEGKLELSAPPVPRRAANRLGAPVALSRIRVRKIADAAGVLVAIGILWGFYDWFLLLPDEPTTTPWELLGAGRDSEVLARRLQGLTRTQSAPRILEGGRPLGQFQFGPPPGYLTGAEPEIQAPDEPTEVYHSLHELETAFNAKYVPPPECYAYESNNLLVRCVNHRIRARRTFVGSGGLVTPSLLGSWEEPREVWVDNRPQDWRQSDQGEGAQDSSREWDQGWQQQSGNQESSLPWGEDYALEPEQGGHTEDAPDRLLHQQGNELTQSAQWDWPGSYEQDPQPHGPQGPVERPALEPEQDWRRGWMQDLAPVPDRDWQREWIRRPEPDPAQDWQQYEAQDADQGWSRGWRSDPVPVERRHWVDDL